MTGISIYLNQIAEIVRIKGEFVIPGSSLYTGTAILTSCKRVRHKIDAERATSLDPLGIAEKHS